MNTNGINSANLETSLLELINVPAERSRSISTREDVLVHEETPDQVLVLPALTETGELEDGNTIIIEHVVDLLHETLEVTNTDVLSHLETGDLVVLALGDGDITVVHAQNLALLLGDASGAESLVTPSGLVTAESDTSSLDTIVDGGEAGEGTPAAADIEQSLALLEVSLLADNGKLVVLELLKGLLLVGVRDDTGGVDHAGTKEPGVEVITAVIVVANLLLIWESVSLSSSTGSSFGSSGSRWTYPGNECA